MIDDKFNIKKFDESLVDDLKLEDLEEQLKLEILWELHPEIQKMMNNIAFELNQTGHNLKEYGYQGLCDLSFRDDFIDKDQSYCCKLRLALTLTLSESTLNINCEKKGRVSP